MLQVFHGFSKNVSIEAKESSHPETENDDESNVQLHHKFVIYFSILNFDFFGIMGILCWALLRSGVHMFLTQKIFLSLFFFSPLNSIGVLVYSKIVFFFFCMQKTNNPVSMNLHYLTGSILLLFFLGSFERCIKMTNSNIFL